MDFKKDTPHKPAPPTFLNTKTTATVEKQVKSRTELVQPVMQYHCPPPHSSQFPPLKIEDLEPFKPSHYIYRSGAECSTRMVINKEAEVLYDRSFTTPPPKPSSYCKPTAPPPSTTATPQSPS